MNIKKWSGMDLIYRESLFEEIKTLPEARAHRDAKGYQSEAISGLKN